MNNVVVFSLVANVVFAVLIASLAVSNLCWMKNQMKWQVAQDSEIKKLYDHIIEIKQTAIKDFQFQIDHSKNDIKTTKTLGDLISNLDERLRMLEKTSAIQIDNLSSTTISNLDRIENLEKLNRMPV